ncbi:hypothetical protein T11_9934 [Trichinella zimbabwensis]|uniref:Uncharacterized protein n=1 Tax=Trichinella zimbabwensis TaxID=268475 RepID=A0A0V1DPF8_9BILA|nr:hypothetical protein T11_9934 [Trichinella zimbabwensis]
MADWPCRYSNQPINQQWNTNKRTFPPPIAIKFFLYL